MKNSMLLTIFVLSTIGAQAQETAYALDESNHLISFKTNATGTLLSNVAISGMSSGASMVGIDFRPSNGRLYGVGSDNKVYTINRTTGVSTAVGSGFTSSLNGTSFGMAFNPVVDRIRVTSNNAQNLRLHPDTGATVATDGTLMYNAGDANVGLVPSIVASAYTNSFAGATSTVLYDIDSNTDSLVIQNPPNAGGLSTVGMMGVDTNEWVGFDISGFTGKAYCSLTTPGANVTSSNFFMMNLATGSPTFVGTIGSGDCKRITSLAIVPEPSTYLAVGAGVLILIRRRKR